jgi:site-specific DNA recombinase
VADQPSPVFPAAIRHAYDLLLAGVSPDSIAGTWNAAGLPAGPDGLPAPSGLRGLWTADRVRAVLSDRDHAGRAVDELGWRRATDQLSAPRRRTAGQPDRALLTAIATCGLCGRPVRSAVVSAGQTAYQCRGGGDRVHLARSTAPVDARVRLEVLDRLDRPGAPELLTNRDTPDLHALGAHSAGLRTRLAGIEDGIVDGDTAAAAAPRLDAELATVEQQMTDHAVRDVPASVTGADPLPEAWDRLAVSRQRGILLALAERIELRPGSPGRRAGDADILGQTVLITWRAL